MRAVALPLQNHLPPPAEAECAPQAYLGEVVEFLIQIDDKLDRVMDLLIHGKGGDSAPPAVLQTVDISGAGMSMVLSAPLGVGQLLQITIRFPGSPLGFFKVLGEVVRIEPASAKEDMVYHTGVRFLEISDAERDRLVAYTFMQQRRTIREAKRES
ncbi:MAG: PilZ domain-containing protein [Desulfobacterales bacterium]